MERYEGPVNDGMLFVNANGDRYWFPPASQLLQPDAFRRQWRPVRPTTTEEWARFRPDAPRVGTWAPPPGEKMAIPGEVWLTTNGGLWAIWECQAREALILASDDEFMNPVGALRPIGNLRTSVLLFDAPPGWTPTVITKSPEPKPEHPAPWEVLPDGSAPENACFSSGLVDADGERVLGPTNDQNLYFASPYVRELIRLAPELEALLRKMEWIFSADEEADECPSCFAQSPLSDGRREHGDGCELAALLAKLDAARKAP